MEERFFRARSYHNCQMLLHGRSAGFIMAVPFVFCFSLFGIFNLVGGAVLTIMSCRPKLPSTSMAFIQRLMRQSNIKLESQLDPMQVVGIILLLTGSLLVVVGISLGIVACRSVDEEHRRRQWRSGTSISGFPASSTTERSSRRASSIALVTFTPRHNYRSDRRKSPSENAISPIMEVNSEEEEDCSNGKSEAQEIFESHTEFIDISPSLSTQDIILSPRKSKDSVHKVTWAPTVLPESTVTVVVAEVLTRTTSESSEISEKEENLNC